MNKPVKVALIGAGGISLAHAKGFLKHRDKIQCVALCDVSDENLAARTDQLGGNPAHFKDWKKMLAAIGGEIDAVDICLPHHLHAPAILDAVAAGKHVLCEKPMCIDLDTADQIVEAVKKAGVIYMSAHNQLFLPAVREIKRMIDAGALGTIIWVRSQDCFVADAAGFQGKWRANLKLQGGGELIDTGYHPTYRLLHLVNSEVVSVRGTMGRFRHEIQGEDTASVQVGFANGVIGEIFTSWACDLPYGSYQIHVIGELGEMFGSGNKLYHLKRGEKIPSEQILDVEQTFEDQIEHFADRVLSGARPLHAAEEGRETLRVILKAAESAEGWQKSAVKKVEGSDAQ